MSLKVNFDPTNNILLGAAMSLTHKTESIAVDALRTIYQSLSEATKRLNEKLFSLFDENSNLDLSPEEPYVYILYSSIMSEIWNIIDSSNRVELALKHIPNAIRQLSNNQFESIFKDIRSARNSFQHLEDRISDYYSTTGGLRLAISYFTTEKTRIRQTNTAS